MHSVHRLYVYVRIRTYLGGRGGRGLEPKSPKVCVPKKAQINTSFGKFQFFALLYPGRGGEGVLDPPPTPGDAELLSKTLLALLCAGLGAETLGAAWGHYSCGR